MQRAHKQPHRYKRTQIGKRYEVYRCMMAGCPHYQPVTLMVGAKFSCYSCSDEAVVASNDDLLEELKCTKCRKLGNVSTEKVLEVLEGLTKDELRDKD